ncbi:MAG TPA: hypothetical protein VE132_04360 [Micromonosporaceae bacterium]|nr:hypothetical protein [Micromonosporaceae bacterium]
MVRGLASIRRSTAGSVEIGAIVALVIGVWWLALGWDWAVAQTPLDWLALAVVAVAAVGWLALRGRAVLGFVVVCVPVVVLSGWRLAAAEVLDWPSEVAALVFGLSVTCMPVALLGWWLRRRVDVVGSDADSQGVVRPRSASPGSNVPDSNVPDSVPESVPHDDEPGDDEPASAGPDRAGLDVAEPTSTEPDDDVDGATTGAADE